jgi:hypothetical protein
MGPPPFIGGYPGGSGTGGSSSGDPFGGLGSNPYESNGGPFGAGLGFDVDRATYIRNIHGILAAVAFVGIFPSGAILMRVVPGRFTIWIHAVLQLLGYATFIAAAGLGIYMVKLVNIRGSDLVCLRSASPS